MIFGSPTLVAPAGKFVTSTITVSGIGPLDVFASANLSALFVLNSGSGTIAYSGFTNAGGAVDLSGGQFSGGVPAFIGLGVTGFTVAMNVGSSGSTFAFMQGTIVITEPV